MATPLVSVAILGSDSTHTKLFAEILSSESVDVGAHVKIKSLWGEDQNQAYQQARLCGLEQNAKSILHALDGVDLALVLGRFGGSHYVPAHIALSNGVPTFVDKPFTSNFTQANDLIELAQKNGVYLASASALRFANEIKLIPNKIDDGPLFLTAFAPANCIDLGSDSRLDSVFFYGIHALEMLLQVVGSSISEFSVTSDEISVSATIRHKRGEAFIHLFRGVNEFYQVNWCNRVEANSVQIQLDGSYNVNLLQGLIKSCLEKTVLVDHANTLLAIKILGEMEKADLITRGLA